jgi:long-chain acyl-CoA synthetase
MKTLGTALILTLCIIWSASRAEAEVPAPFAPSITLENKTLYLNGVGVRKVTIFGVKVYRAGLYLEKKSTHADEILNSPELKRIDLVFLRDASQKQISDAWRESLQKNCGEYCAAAKPMAEKLIGMMTALKEGDILSFVFYPDHVTVFLHNQQIGAIDGAIFERIVLLTWLGPNPPNSDLKEGMLGR